jgi:hypothetical protein
LEGNAAAPKISAWCQVQEVAIADKMGLLLDRVEERSEVARLA